MYDLNRHVARIESRPANPWATVSVGGGCTHRPRQESHALVTPITRRTGTPAAAVCSTILGAFERRSVS